MLVVFWHLPPAAKHTTKGGCIFDSRMGKTEDICHHHCQSLQGPRTMLARRHWRDLIFPFPEMESITSTLHTWFWKRYCSVLHPDYFIIFMELTSKEVSFHGLHISWTRSGKWPKKSHKLLLSTLGFAVPAARRWEHHKLLCSVGCWAVIQWLKYATLIPVPWQSSQWSRWAA